MNDGRRRARLTACDGIMSDDRSASPVSQLPRVVRPGNEFEVVTEEGVAETEALTGLSSAPEFKNVRTPRARGGGVLRTFKKHISIFPLVHTQLWVAAAYSLLAPLFPALVRPSLSYDDSER